MRKTTIIARREYRALVRTKAFMISLVIMPVFMFGGIFLQGFLSGRVDIGEKKIVVIDGTGRLFAPLSTLARMYNETEVIDKSSGRNTKPTITLEKGPEGPVTDEMRLDLSERIHRNELFAFVEIDADALRPAADSPLLKMLQSMEATRPADSHQPSEIAADAANNSTQSAPVQRRVIAVLPWTSPPKAGSMVRTSGSAK